MSEIIDVLALAPADCPFFVVDTTQLYVDMQYPAAGNHIMKRAGAANVFDTADNVTFLTMGFVMPESFTFACPPLATTIWPFVAFIPRLWDGTQVFNIVQFGNSGIQIPLWNYEMPVGIYMNVNTDVSPVTGIDPSGYSITCDISDLSNVGAVPPRVSMQNVPVTLNGTTQYIIPFIKILHTIAL